MNPEFNIEAQLNKVCPENEEFYSPSFYENLDGVANALDNVQARLYVDKQCVLHGRPLLESGTLGTKGNTQVVVPELTVKLLTELPSNDKFKSILLNLIFLLLSSHLKIGILFNNLL